MARRLAAVAAVAWAGMAQAQTPAFNPGSPPEGSPGSVVTLRTAGQPERKLQILKAERLPDGKILTEVKDLATGQVFSIADTKMLGSDTAKAALPIATPASAPPPAPMAPPPPQPPVYLPGTNVSSSNLLPQAKPRQADPLLGQTPSHMPVNAAPKSPSQAEFPTLVGKLREPKATTPAFTPASTPGAAPQSAVSKALFGSYDQAPQPPATLVSRITEPGPPKPLTAPLPAHAQGGLKAAVFGTPQEQPVEQPTLMGKLFGDKPAPVVQPTQVAKQSSPGMIRPNAVGTAAPSRLTPAFEPTMASPAPIVMPVVPARATLPAEPLTPVSLDAREPNFHVVPMKPMTMKQIEEMVKDLRMHHKPSSRLEAANSLAACPMAGMVEVRQILAEASYRDPVPVVRAHCIDLLTKMQYDEPNYRKYVEGLVNDDEPAVQRAARNAVK